MWSWELCGGDPVASGRWEGEHSSLFQTAHFDLFQRQAFLNKISTEERVLFFFYIFFIENLT